MEISLIFLRVGKILSICPNMTHKSSFNGMFATFSYKFFRSQEKLSAVLPKQHSKSPRISSTINGQRVPGADHRSKELKQSVSTSNSARQSLQKNNSAASSVKKLN
jgi:hypothetical protein